MNILDKLADGARERVRAKKQIYPVAEITKQAKSLPKGDFPFERALSKKDAPAFICECKKASPSKGIIAEDFPYAEIAREYEAAGADAISVLTEPNYFLGSDKYLREIAATVKLPCLRKDFLVDEYMIYEAKVLGAAAVLFIVSLFAGDSSKLAEYLSIARSLGLSALVETHDENEIKTACAAGAKIIGVNNRNLKNFTVDTGHSLTLRKIVPPDILFVTESGITNAEDVARAKAAGVNAVLVGETLMRAADKRQMLNRLKGIAP